MRVTTNVFPGAAGPELRRDSLTRAVYEEAVGGGQVKLTVHRAEQLEKKDLGGKVAFTFTLSCLHSAQYCSKMDYLFWEKLSKMGNFEEILAKKKIKIDLKPKFIVNILRERT